MEQLRDPTLAGKAIAIQQHSDIIALNAAAKAAGVQKHCTPDAARKALALVGGKVVHVHTEEGYRVSYGPYRDASSRLMRVLEGLPCAAVVERASIDEAFILYRPPPHSVSEDRNRALHTDSTTTRSVINGDPTTVAARQTTRAGAGRGCRSMDAGSE